MAVIATIEGLRDFGASITSQVSPPFFVEDPALIRRRSSLAAKAEATARQADREATIAGRRARKLTWLVRMFDRKTATPTMVAARRNAAVEAIAQARRALAARTAARAARTVAKLEKARAAGETKTRRPAVAIRQALARAMAHAKRVQAARVVQARNAAATSEAARMRRAEARLHVVRRGIAVASGNRLRRLRDEAQRLQAAAESARATAQRFSSQVKAPSTLPADPRAALAPYVDKAVSAARDAADKVDDALDTATGVAGRVLRAAHNASGGNTPLPDPVTPTDGGAAKLAVPAAIGVAALWLLL